MCVFPEDLRGNKQTNKLAQLSFKSFVSSYFKISLPRSEQSEVLIEYSAVSGMIHHLAVYYSTHVDG